MVGLIAVVIAVAVTAFRLSVQGRFDSFTKRLPLMVIAPIGY